MALRTLEGKTVAITGGAAGIGYEIVDNCLKKNAKLVIILDLNEDTGSEAVTKLTEKYGANKAVFYKCNVTKDLDAVAKQIFDNHTTVDVFFNNAGVLDDKNWERCIDINVKAMIGWGMKMWDHMRTDKGGKGGTIVNTASIFGFHINRHHPVYQASKFAVMGFTRSLGHEENFRKSGVRVVALCPGCTDTTLTRHITSYDDDFFMVGFADYGKTVGWQSVEFVGKGAVDLFERADSGTAWLADDGKPIVKVD